MLSSRLPLTIYHPLLIYFRIRTAVNGTEVTYIDEPIRFPSETSFYSLVCTRSFWKLLKSIFQGLWLILKRIINHNYISFLSQIIPSFSRSLRVSQSRPYTSLTPWINFLSSFYHFKNICLLLWIHSWLKWNVGLRIRKILRSSSNFI